MHYLDLAFVWIGNTFTTREILAFITCVLLVLFIAPRITLRRDPRY